MFYFSDGRVLLEYDNRLRIFLDGKYNSKNKILNIFMNKSFKYGLDKIADAFQNRAEKLFNKVSYEITLGSYITSIASACPVNPDITSL